MGRRAFGALAVASVSLLVALKRPRAGFAVWLRANVLWITWAAVHHYLAMVVMLAVYLVITVVGLWRWRPAD